MSDLGDPTVPRPPTTVPPPPPSSALPPRPTAPPPDPGRGPWPSSTPQFGPPGTPSPYGPRSEFGQQQYRAMSVPRPAVPVGALLLLVGGLMAVVGSMLTWFTFDGRDFTGFSRGSSNDVKDGPYFLTFGIALAAFGIALFAARKILALTIIGIVVAALTIIFSLADLGSVDDVKKLAALFDRSFSTGPGLYLCVFGGLIALAGSIAATAKRRR